jgi:HEAT repeat protein
MPLLGDPEPGIWGRARVQVWQRMDDDAMLAEVIRTAREGPGASRAKALEMLPAEYTAQLRDSLLTGLRDQAPEVRRAVVSKLINDPAPGTTDALLAALQDERDPRVASWLLSALGRLRERGALTPAVRWLDHPDAGASAVKALAAIGTSTAVRHIRSALTDGLRTPHVRATAARALGELGDRKAVDLLLPLIHGPNEELRRGALAGLASLGEHRLPRRDRRRVVETLLDHLVTDDELPWHTGHGLSSCPEALPRLRHLADDASGTRRRWGSADTYRNTAYARRTGTSRSPCSPRSRPTRRSARAGRRQRY